MHFVTHTVPLLCDRKLFLCREKKGSLSGEPDGLPDTKNVLHNKAYSRNAYPAGKAHNDWFTAGFDQLHNVSIQTDRCHGKDDKELAQFLDGREHSRAYTE